MAKQKQSLCSGSLTKVSKISLDIQLSYFIILHVLNVSRLLSPLKAEDNVENNQFLISSLRSQIQYINESYDIL